MTRQITGPIIRLRNAVLRFGQGDLKLRVTPEANDEIGDLAGTFNTMADTLKGTMVSRDYVNNILESMSDGLVVLTPDLRFRMVNKAAYFYLSCREGDEVVGAPGATLFPGAQELLDTFREGGGRASMETRLNNASGLACHLSISIAPLLGRDRVAGSMLLIQDISAHKESEEKLRCMANYDALTGLANRNMLTLCLNQNVSRLPWSGRFDRYGEEADQLPAKVEDAARREMASAKSAGDSAVKMSMTWIIATILAALAFGMMLGISLTRVISVPIVRIIDNLNDGSLQVVAAAGQLSSASQSLSMGASNQAASVEETSASLEEISSMTEKNANNVRQADSLMQEADRAAGRGHTSMAELNGSMQQIAKASESIPRSSRPSRRSPSRPIYSP